MIEVNTKKLPKNLRDLNKEELTDKVSTHIKISKKVLEIFSLDELQYLLVKIKKHGTHLYGFKWEDKFEKFSKKELIVYINKKLKLHHTFLVKLSHQQLKDLFMNFKKNTKYNHFGHMIGPKTFQ